MEELGVCLDTSVLINYFRKKDKKSTLFYSLADDYSSFSITSITEFEIRCGINANQKDIWDELLSDIKVLSFDSESSQIAAQLDKKLKKHRKQLALADLFIASIAIRHNHALATLNKKHFERISDLRIIS